MKVVDTQDPREITVTVQLTGKELVLIERALYFDNPPDGDDGLWYANYNLFHDFMALLSENDLKSNRVEADEE